MNAKSAGEVEVEVDAYAAARGTHFCAVFEGAEAIGRVGTSRAALL